MNNFKYTLIAAMLTLSAAAFADSNNGNGNGQGNGCGNGNGNSQGSDCGNGGNTSNGGSGGAGGNATANQGQGQLQGQLQGQGQSQGQGQVATGGNAAAGAISGSASKSTSTSVAGAAAGAASKSNSNAVTGPVNSSNQNTNTNQNNTSVGGQFSNLATTMSMTVNEAAQPTKTTVEHTGTSTVKTAPDVYAPPSVTTAVCVIGASGGVSGLGWGVAIGGGIKDDGCEVRALASLLYAHGAADAAKELLCAAEPRVAAAYAAVGKPCKEPIK